MIVFKKSLYLLGLLCLLSAGGIEIYAFTKPVETNLIASANQISTNQPTIQQQPNTDNKITDDKKMKIEEAAGFRQTNSENQLSADQKRKVQEATGFSTPTPPKTEDSTSWMSDFRKDLLAINLDSKPKDLAESSLSFAKKWEERVKKKDTDTFFNKSDDHDYWREISTNVSSLKTWGNSMLNKMDTI